MTLDMNTYLSSLIGGGAAGIAVDVSLFPLDTLKTRLQSGQGFHRAGGFTGIYRGIGPQVLGSAPQAALFFCTYDLAKDSLSHVVPSHLRPLVYMFAASLGEAVACIVRVPIEVVKQRRQISNRSVLQIAASAYRAEGFLGFFRGFGSTLLREVPFSIIQFPLIEQLKLVYAKRLNDAKDLNSLQVANCGAIAGGMAAGITTPLDVLKTRIMLAEKKDHALKFGAILNTICREQGVAGFFAGLVPRVLWITIGGYVFFGTYDYVKNLSSNALAKKAIK